MTDTDRRTLEAAISALRHAPEKMRTSDLADRVEAMLKRSAVAREGVPPQPSAHGGQIS